MLTVAWDWLPIALGAVAYAGTTIMAMLGGLSPKEWGNRSWAAFVFFVACGLAALLLGGLKERGIAKLRREHDELVEKLGGRDYFRTFDDLAAIFAEMLGCTDNERVTIYLRSGNSFVVLGRFAKRPQLSQRSRPLYPLEEGLIASAWRDGWAFEPCLPHPDGDEYVTEVERRWHVPREVTARMRMRARSLGGSVVLGSDRSSLAVIIFESKKCRRWSENELRAFGTSAALAVAQMLQVMKPYEPNPLVAKNEGL